MTYPTHITLASGRQQPVRRLVVFGILFIDQEIRQALNISDYVYVMESGRNKFEGPASEFTDLEKAFWVGGGDRDGTA